MNASTFAGSLIPGADSTPEATSTAHGCTAAMPSATFSGVSPPDRISGTCEWRWAPSLPVPRAAGAAVGRAGRGVEQVELGVEALRVADVGARADAAAP